MLSLATALALTLSAAGCGPPPLSAYRPWAPGERLTFDVEALGVTERGGLSLAVEPVAGSPETVSLAATAHHRGPFYGVRGAARSWVGTRSLLPARFHDESRGRTLRSTDSQLDAPGLAVRVYWVNGDKRGMNAFVRGPAVHDLLSAVYYLRAARLDPGAAFCFDVVGGRTYWRLSGRVVPGTARAQTPAGIQQTVRLDGTATRSDDPSQHHRVHLWLGADARRLPMVMEIETRLGAVRAALASAAGP